MMEFETDNIPLLAECAYTSHYWYLLVIINFIAIIDVYDTVIELDN